MTPVAGGYRPRLQRRLMAAFTGFTLLVAAVVGALAIVFVYVVEDTFFDGMLQAESERQRLHQATTARYTVPALPFVTLHAGAQTLPAELARDLARHPARQEFAGSSGRHYHVRQLDASGTLLVAEVGAQLVVRPMREELIRWLLGATACLVVLALTLAAWLSRRMAAPLATLAGRVASSAPQALPHGLADGLPHDEVGELARRLDALYARTSDFIAREQAFTADVGHELKTPLSVLSIACERLQAQAGADLQPMLRSMQSALRQLGQMVDLMLALAREAPNVAEGGQVAERPLLPLLPMLEQLLLAQAPLLDRQGVQLEIEVSPRLTRPWSPALTQLLVGNLLANAVAHAQPAQVRIEADDDMLRISNPSAPPPAMLLGDDTAGRVRGIKGDTSTGQGFGLTIVRRLAEASGLALQFEYRDGRTCVTLRSAGRR